MSRSRTLRLALLMILAVTTVGADSGEPNARWKAVAASGPIDWRGPGTLELTASGGDETAAPERPWAVVRRGDRLVAGSEVRTARRGRATFVSRAGVIVVDAESHVVLPATTRGGNLATQRRGSAIYEVDGSRQQDFRVETPYLVAGVKGTVFLVRVSDHGASVTVREGVVEVTSQTDGERTLLQAGDTILVRDGDESGLLRADAGEKSNVDRATRHVSWINEQRLDRSVDDRRHLLLAAVAEDEDTGIVQIAARLLTDPVTSPEGRLLEDTTATIDEQQVAALLDRTLDGLADTSSSLLESIAGEPPDAADPRDEADLLGELLEGLPLGGGSGTQ